MFTDYSPSECGHMRTSVVRSKKRGFRKVDETERATRERYTYVPSEIAERDVMRDVRSGSFSSGQAPHKLFLHEHTHVTSKRLPQTANRPRHKKERRPASNSTASHRDWQSVKSPPSGRRLIRDDTWNRRYTWFI